MLMQKGTTMYIRGSEFVGNVWENGEFGVAASKMTSKHMPESNDRLLKDNEQIQWMLNIVKVHGIEAALVYAREYFPVAQDGSDGAEMLKASLSLGLSTLPNSHKAVKRGEKGITTYGKRLVRNACFRLEREVDKRHLTFLTVTLPDIDVAESLEISRNWSEIVRQFQQSLRRALQAAKLPGEIVGVTELQLERFERTGVFGLHLHLVFQGRTRYKSWALDPERVRLYWRNALRKYLRREAESYKWESCENLQHVKKSVESYLGKYMSKGVRDAEIIHEKHTGYVFPSSWYLCSLSLRERVHNRVIRLSGVPASHLVDMASSKSCESVFKYRSPVVLSTDNVRDLVIGWYGRLTAEGYEYLQDLFIEHAIQRDERIDKFMMVEGMH